ncbi:MAG: ImmA/IrrE family metallo-endopeptidase [Acetobacterium sp.]|uniref:ImmA/IrrE family metallo-endopeptidase n=1 Tax=Acetobacterium sp. TaxID=1872094 RepID=UPI00324233B3
MFKHCEECALSTLESNNISEFPTPIYTIEQIIIDHDFDIVIIPTLTKSGIFDKTLFVPHLPDFEFRVSLAHELGHIILHEFFIHSAQSEARADAFAAYFLMPSGHFEDHAPAMTKYDLSEFYGVPVNFINKRMELSIDLIQ